MVAGSAWLLALENWVPGTCGGGRGFAEFGGGGGGAAAAAAAAAAFVSLLFEEEDESVEFFLPSCWRMLRMSGRAIAKGTDLLHLEAKALHGGRQTWPTTQRRK